MKVSKKYKRIIQLELNEISYPIIEHLIEKNRLPNFKKLDKNWQYLQTDSEDEYDKIEPWIQWVTAHTGKSFAEHGIFNLGDVHKLKHTQIWERLSEVGIESGIIGSMNAAKNTAKGGMFFPDPWAIHAEAFPEKLKPLWQLISSRVQSHATSKLGIGDLLKGVRSCLQFNIPISTYFSIANQILQQKLEPKVKWKLAIVFDLFQAELFKNILRKTEFGYYTLFLNAIAHYQHHYWRNYSREGFNPSIKYDDIRPDDDPISYGYGAYDKILGEIINIVKDDPDTLIIIASGLSQIPYTDKEDQGGMNYYRLKDHQSFANNIGIGAEQGFEVFPLMSRDWQIKYKNEEQKIKALNVLKSLNIRGEKLFNIREDVAEYIFIETAYTKQAESNDNITLEGKSISTFLDTFSNIAIKSGHHTGVGNLWLSGNAMSNYSRAAHVQLSDLYDFTFDALSPS